MYKFLNCQFWTKKKLSENMIFEKKILPSGLLIPSAIWWIFGKAFGYQERRSRSLEIEKITPPNI